MRKYIIILVVFLTTACLDDSIVDGTAVSFYPNLVDSVVEGSSTSATLELTGPGNGTVTIQVSDPQFITTTPALVDGTLELNFDNVSSQSFDIQTIRGGRAEDYTVTFDVINVTGDIQDIAEGSFKLFVNTVPALSLPFFDDFEACAVEFSTPEMWIEEFVGDSKTDRGWACRATDGVNGSRGVRASAFGGEEGTDHAWLITNGSIDLRTVPEAFMTFDMSSNFAGDGDLFVFWSEDYSGAGDPTAATWNEFPGLNAQLPAEGSGTFQSVAVELTSIVGKSVFVGFQYIGASNTSSASFELDNFSVSTDGSGFEFYSVPFSDDFNTCSDFSIPSSFMQERTDGSKQDRGWSCDDSGVDGSQAVRASALGGAVGTVDAWLISSKQFDLNNQATAILSFDLKSEIDGPGDLNVLHSENYTGSGDPSSASWTPFTGFTLPDGGSNSFSTIEIDLADVLGKTVYIAFQYIGGTNSNAITFDLDNISVSTSGSGGGGGGGGGGGTMTDTGDCTLSGAGTVIVSHDFDDCTADFSIPNGFIEAIVPGFKTDRGWGCRADGTDGSRAVRASAFGGEAGTDNAWLIMDPFDASPYTEFSLNFDVQSPFDGPGDLNVLYSNDYSGSGDPTQATWSSLDNVTAQLPTAGAGEFANVTTSPCSLSGTEVYIAFQYVNGASDNSAAWSIDNLELRGN